MENKTEESIKCVYSFSESFFDNQAKDKTIYLKGNQKDTLFIFNQISPGVYDPEDGKKMSKSLQNYPDPELIFNNY